METREDKLKVLLKILKYIDTLGPQELHYLEETLKTLRELSQRDQPE